MFFILFGYIAIAIHNCLGYLLLGFSIDMLTLFALNAIVYIAWEKTQISFQVEYKKRIKFFKSRLKK